MSNEREDAEAPLEEIRAGQVRRPLRAGDRIGSYKIIRELGSGGMGVVFLAQHMTLDRRTVLKVLYSSCLRNPESIARFRIEAKTLAKLRHPNVVQVYDFVEIDGEYVLSMGHVNGATLRQVIETNRRYPAVDQVLQIGETIQTVCGILRGIAACHDAGIVHRDLKPTNIIIQSNDGTPVIIDFGIAKDLEGPDDVTRDRVIVGSARYMAPEQSDTQKKIDHRADLYAVGLIFFEMLSGHALFRGLNQIEIIARQAELSAEAFPEAGPLPPELRAILLRALAWNPDDRYQSAEEMIAALEGAWVAISSKQEPERASSPPVPPDRKPSDLGWQTPRQPRRRNRRPAIFAAALLACAAAAALFVLAKREHRARLDSYAPAVTAAQPSSEPAKADTPSDGAGEKETAKPVSWAERAKQVCPEHKVRADPARIAETREAALGVSVKAFASWTDSSEQQGYADALYCLCDLAFGSAQVSRNRDEAMRLYERYLAITKLNLLRPEEGRRRRNVLLWRKIDSSK